MAMEGRATVVITVYDTRPDWLHEAVSSAAREDCPVLVSDDGSQAPDTLSALIDLPRAWPDLLRVVRGDHVGMEGALNRAIEQVQTPYVAICDSDDRSCPGRIAHEAEYLDRSATTGVVHGRCNYLAPDGSVILRNVLPRSPCHSTLMFRRSLWSKVGGYPSGHAFGEGDTAFLGRACAVLDLAMLPIVLAERRIHPGSLTFRRNPRLQRIYAEYVERERRGVSP